MTSRSSAQSRQLPGAEAKNNQDVSAGSKSGKSSGGGVNSFIKGFNRRREPAQGSLANLNPAKPGPRTKNSAGKRPQPRGGYYQDKSYQHFATHQIDEDDECELGSIFTPGGRKQNYNHLLNFQYDSHRGGARHDNNRNQGRGNRHPTKRYDKRQPEVVRPKYDHTHYLQANCQFVVRADQDYSVQCADPDTMVQWDNIEQVQLRVASDDLTSCPICLFPPTAAKMSECGHVYCWACILHYLALSDEDNRPCPICHQAITKAGLKSVNIISKHSYSTGEKVTMTLMKRERNSMFAVPVTNNFLSKHPDLSNKEVDTNYVKLFLANPEQIKTDILDQERRELEQQWRLEKDQPEACFIQEALKLLDARQVETLLRPKMMKPPSPVMKEPLIPGLSSLTLESPTSPTACVDPFAEEMPAASSPEEEERPRHVSGVSSDSVSSGDDNVTDMVDEGVTVTDLDISTVQQQDQGPGQPRQVFYFYQSSDGQPIFLHALNIQMLVKQFGSLENCPPVIEAEILEKEGAVMSENLRDRLRYLKHLPVSTNFEVAELDMIKLVSKETMTMFKEQVETRRRKRNRKARDEKRREKKIQHEELRMMGLNPDMVRVESDYYYKSKVQEATGGQTDQFPAMSTEENDAQGHNSSAGASFSFANITKTKPAAPVQSSPAVKTVSSGTTWTCLGAVKPLQSLRNTPAKVDSDHEEASEDYVPPPSMASLGDTLAAALQRADGQNKGNTKKGGKKGRGKTVLLSGGAPRPHM